MPAPVIFSVEARRTPNCPPDTGHGLRWRFGGALMAREAMSKIGSAVTKPRNVAMIVVLPAVYLLGGRARHRSHLT
ncbi:hypothetical protein ACFYUV_09970 [Nonomuraea sp. NPDC003560]|uniref:hypothetical protein n=1 Tax=Nonomuraea sp. NPDC003560 TaxID=3364341 RepID=UPI00369CD1CD